MDIATVKEKHTALRKLIHDAIVDFQDETGCQVSLVAHTRDSVAWPFAQDAPEPVRKELIIDLTTVVE